ncbi:MAG: GMP synthase [glutamine-hydrolyzing] subunit A [Methanonatronarchaeales archaeon]|nr:GMP synthase [glutamine-hydrolyzing] subunit A [Methanonatronarchaeales archaeon]
MEVVCLSPSELFDYCPVAHRVSNHLATTDLRFENFRPHEGDVPRGTGYDAVLVMGSRYHVFDDLPWIDATQGFAIEALERSVPVLGVCFGHQLVADALGGEVGAMEDREMGYRTVEVTEAGLDDDLFHGVPDEFLVFQSHLDAVFDVPDVTVLAENDFGIQAFRHDEHPAYGVQFHPEYSLDMARALVEAKDLQHRLEGDVEASLTEENFRESLASRRVFGNFFDRVCDAEV